MTILVNNAILERQENQVRDYYEARQQANQIAQQNNMPISKHLEPEALYLMEEDWQSLIQARQPTQITPFLEAEHEAEHVYAFSARMGRNFSAERAMEKVNIFDLLAAHVKKKNKHKGSGWFWPAGAMAHAKDYKACLKSTTYKTQCYMMTGRNVWPYPLINLV